MKEIHGETDQTYQSNDGLREAVERALPNNPERVFPLVFAGQKLWVKRAITHKRRVWHRFQRIAAGVFNSPILSVTADTAGMPALLREAAIIEALRSKDIRVPKVALTGPGWLVLTDVGDSLEARLRKSTTRDERRSWALAGASALVSMHQHNAWHGNPLLRNITERDGQIGFIDFEEDPARQMSRTSCQARDVLFYVFSVCRFAREDRELHALVLRDYLRRASPEVVAQLRSFLRMLTPVAVLLTPLRKVGGRDIVQGLNAWTALRTELAASSSSRGSSVSAQTRRISWRRWALILLSLGAVGYGVASLTR